MAKETSFESELILHRITQSCLNIFNLEFVASEFQFKNQRFDTLAYDRQNNSFVIIEYKNEFNQNVLNQCRDYYNLLLDNKEAYIDKFNEVFSTDKGDFDFKKTRVMIIGPEFSKKQIEESFNYPFELWKVTLYDNNEIIYKELLDGKSKIIEVGPNELSLTEDDLLKGKSKQISNLYRDLKNRILSEFDGVHEVILIDAVAFKINRKIICIANIKKKIKIYFYADELNDRKKRTRDISDITTGGPSNYEFAFDSADDLDYAIDLFKQTYMQRRN